MMKDISRQGIDFNDKEAPLKSIREFLGMTQKDFGVLLGVAEESVNRWERGKRSEPRLTIVQFKRLVEELRNKGIDILDIPDFLGKPT